MTALKQSAIESAQDYRDMEVQPRSNIEVFGLRKASKRLIASTLFAHLILLPLMFGGVHARVFLTIDSLTFFVIAAVTFLERRTLLNLWTQSRMRIPIYWFGAFIGFCIVQYLVLGLQRSAHPVLGVASLQPPLAELFTNLRPYLRFLALLFLADIWVRNVHTIPFLSSHRNAKIIDANALPGTFTIRAWIPLVVIIGCGISLIGLSHWFYDSGKLFGLFESDYGEPSGRARWPFVNPNNLAQFILPAVFLAVGTVLLKLHQLTESVRSRRRAGFVDLIAERRHYKHVVQAGLYGLILLTLALTLAGTLSRGAWLGAAIGILVFWAMRLRYLRRSDLKRALSGSDYAKTSGSDPATMLRRDISRRSRRNRHAPRDSNFLYPFFQNLRTLAMPLFIVMACVLFLSSLNERGRELVVARIDYGLTSSLDDIRFQLYADSTAFVSEHPLLGLGMNAWRKHFGERMSPNLADINPVYLHSDPLQFLIEYGVIGSALFAGFLLSILVPALRFLRTPATVDVAGNVVDYEARKYVIALLSGLTALFVASCFEFPFHIPAIASLTAVLLVLLMSLGTRAFHSTSSERAGPLSN